MTRPQTVAAPDLEALVESVRADPQRRDELVPLLREDAAIHRDLSTAATARMRGWILASFAEIGLPPEALPFVLEELTTGVEPYLIAAAARATRAATDPDPSVAEGLVTALERIRGRDDAVSFEGLLPTWPTASSTTASAEIVGAIRSLGASAATALPALRAVRDRCAASWGAALRRSVADAIRHLENTPETTHHCCQGDPAPAASPCLGPQPGAVDLTIALEDQDGEQLTLGELLSAPLTMVAFFYTRCTNPEKCSATITNLGRLHDLLASDGSTPDVGIAAVTYDPGYDTPARLRRYGTARGLRFGRSVKSVRCVERQEDLARAFALRVGYNGSIVNRHAIELYLMSQDGRVLDSWNRVRWEPADVVATLRRKRRI